MTPTQIPVIPDLATPADQICDPMLLLARVGYRTYLYFQGPTAQPPSIAQREMMADLDRLTELLNND